MNDRELFRLVEALLRETGPSLFREQLVDVLRVNREVLTVDTLAGMSERARQL